MAFKNIEGNFICEVCGKEFTKSQSLLAHKGSHVQKKFKRIVNNERVAWNKGLTKEDPRIQRQIEGIKKSYKEGKAVPIWKGKQLPDEMKSAISNSMKLAHYEGRAHNIGKSRWNNEQSYPEKFF